MRKVNANDLFGNDIHKSTTLRYTKTLRGPNINSFRKQGEYGEKKRIKP